MWHFSGPYTLFVMYLAGKEMPTDFHKDLVVLVWSLVPRYDDLSTRKVLQLVYLQPQQGPVLKQLRMKELGKNTPI